MTYDRYRSFRDNTKTRGWLTNKRKEGTAHASLKQDNTNIL